MISFQFFFLFPVDFQQVWFKGSFVLFWAEKQRNMGEGGDTSVEN